MNTKRIFSFALAALVLLISLSAKAQLKGVLKDSVSQNGIAFANVGVLRLPDSVFVRGTASDEDGKFSIGGLKSGEYVFQVSCIGYANVSRKIEVKGRTDLGTVFMRPSSTTFEAIEIVEKRPLFSMEGEKTMYNVEDDPSIQTGTATDALQNAPGVSVDADGNITLQGVNCVEIWLNDEPSKIKSEGLKTFLENLPANALQRIEVITHPSAKYATAGECGVINIVTNTKIKKNHFLSFGLRANSRPSYSPHFSYVWANEKLSFSFYSNLSINNNHTSSDTYAYSLRPNAQGGKDTTYYEEITGESDNKRVGGWFSLNFDYTIDSTSNISAWAGVSPRWSRTHNTGTLSRRDFDLTDIYNSTYSTSFYQSERLDTSFSAWGNLNARYRKNFDKKGHRLDVSLSGHFSPDKRYENYTRQYTPVSELYSDLNKQYEVMDNGYDLSLDSRYTRPYSKKGEVSAGLNFDIDNEHSYKDVWCFDTLASAYSVMDSLRTTYGGHNTKTAGGYLQWQHRFGLFTVELGTRAYLENSNYLMHNAYPKADNPMFYDQTDRTFFRLRPSVHLSYRTKSMHNFSFSYSYSTSKPSLENLSEFRRYDEDSYSTGNPALEPSYSHTMRLNWSKFFMSAGFVGIFANANWSNNDINSPSASEYDPYLGKWITYTKPYNLGSSSSQSIMAMMNLRLGAFTNLNINATLSHNDFSIRYTDGNFYEDENLNLMLHGRLWAKFLKNYQVFLNGFIDSPTRTLFAESEAHYSMSVGVSADLFDRKLSLTLQVQDPFNWNKSSSSVYAPDYVYYSSTVRDSRFISFGITLRFGKLELENKQAPQSGGKSE